MYKEKNISLNAGDGSPSYNQKCSKGNEAQMLLYLYTWHKITLALDRINITFNLYTNNQLVYECANCVNSVAYHIYAV